MRPEGAALEYFLSYTREEDRGYKTPCVVWTGALGGKGAYGTFTWVVGKQRIQRVAHRLSYELFVGPIPPKYEVDHLCRVHECVKPVHLEAVTKAVNMARTRKEICGNGHELTEDNIYRHPRTGNIHGCKECRREAVRRSKGR